MLSKQVVASVALCAMAGIGVGWSDEVTVRGSSLGYATAESPLSFEGADFSASTSNGTGSFDASNRLGTFTLSAGPLSPASTNFFVKLTLNAAGTQTSTRVLRAIVSPKPEGGVSIHFVDLKAAARFDNGTTRGSFGVKPQDLSVDPGQSAPLLAELSGSQETDTACQVTFTSARAVPQILDSADPSMTPVTIKPLASDRAGCALACKIEAVSLNEPQGPLGDYEITGDLTLKLRADRLSNGYGRLYTVAVRCADRAGNSATQNVPVAVPSGR